MASKRTTSQKADTTVKAEKTFTNDEVKAAVEAALNEYKAANPPVVQIAKEEYVTLLFIGAVAVGTSVALGKLGKINKAGATRDIPKKEFLQEIGTPLVDALLSKRNLIVVNGLTDEERERFGLKYREGELLSQKMFFQILNYAHNDVCNIFEKLCEEHKRVIAKMYLSAYFDNHDNRVRPETVKALNKLSKTVEKDGLFTAILEDMGNKFTED